MNVLMPLSKIIASSRSTLIILCMFSLLGLYGCGESDDGDISNSQPSNNNVQNQENNNDENNSEQGTENNGSSEIENNNTDPVENNANNAAPNEPENNVANNTTDNNNPSDNNNNNVVDIEVAGSWEIYVNGQLAESNVTIDNEYWNRMLVNSFDNDERWAVTQNPYDDDYYPGKFNKFVWTPIEDGTFYVCNVAFAIDSEFAAVAAENIADDSDLENEGCDGYPWVKYQSI